MWGFATGIYCFDLKRNVIFELESALCKIQTGSRLCERSDIQIFNTNTNTNTITKTKWTKTKDRQFPVISKINRKTTTKKTHTQTKDQQYDSTTILLWHDDQKKMWTAERVHYKENRVARAWPCEDESVAERAQDKKDRVTRARVHREKRGRRLEQIPTQTTHIQ